MGRYDKDSDPREQPASSRGAPGGPSAPEVRPAPELRDDVTPARRSTARPLTQEPRSSGARSIYELRGKTYRLNERQVAALTAIGAFRAIRARDLVQNVYSGDLRAFQTDSRALIQQNLANAGRLLGKPQDEYLSLTAGGKDLTEARLAQGPNQKFYAGLAKPKELEHDAALYRMYVKELQEIEEKGGRPTRVVLDYEFKQQLAKDLNDAASLPPPDRKAELDRIARAQSLTVVDGKVPLPDLRIEYETRDGERAHCDLEFVTDNYRAGAILEKARAGFTLYTNAGSISRKIRDEYPSLVAQILSL